ncbi:MAG TPA: type II secretion system protein [bacterium]|jgi:prepilin-type N-terminal cleavage/methylation domain-containing protein|nr:type II secretion system protein [bacterium]
MAKLSTGGGMAKKIVRRNGFTLIELLVVVAIIAILASLVIINLSSRRQASATSQLQNTARQIATSANLYFDDHPEAVSVLYDDMVPDYITELPRNLELVGNVISFANGESNFELIGNGGPADGCAATVVGSVVPDLEDIRQTCPQ